MHYLQAIDFNENCFKNIGNRIKIYCQMKRKKILEEVVKEGKIS